MIITTAGIGLFVEAIKRSWPKLPKKYLPRLSMITGLVLGIGGAIAYMNFNYIIYGAIAGVAASGSYDLLIDPFKKK